MNRPIITALLLMLSPLALSCDTTKTCTPQSCSSGCCDASGQCQPGTSPQACGTSAAACAVCGANTTCSLGLCTGNSSNGGGSAATGGGSGFGGGSAVGGGTSTGGGSAAGGGTSSGGGSASGGGNSDGGSGFCRANIDCPQPGTCNMITGVCKCADGYTRVGSACVDVDECATDNGGCSVNADCINGTGSFTCSCKSGFSGDGTWCAHWVQANVAGPSARSGARMTWDSMREKVVLFGGAAANGSRFGDTWEWNGSGWTDTGLTGPSARSEMGLSYDSVRHVVVLYGGSGNPSNDDTWEYDGTSWQQRSVTGPPGRTSVRMVFDEARGVTVLFGGYGAAGTGDSTTWEWDGTAWAQKLVTGPGPRWSPNLVFDSFRQSVVLNGGGNYSNSVYVTVNDTWEFKGTAWSLLTNAGPTPRLDADMVFHPAIKKSLVFAGRTGMPSGTTTAQQDTWTLSGTWSQLTTVTAPPARYGHAMAYDRARKAVVVFGGRDVNGGGLGDTWLLKE